MDQLSVYHWVLLAIGSLIMGMSKGGASWGWEFDRGDLCLGFGRCSWTGWGAFVCGAPFTRFDFC